MATSCPARCPLCVVWSEKRCPIRDNSRAKQQVSVGFRVGPPIAINSVVKSYAAVPIAALLWVVASPGQSSPLPAAPTSLQTSPSMPNVQSSGAAKQLTLEDAIAMAVGNHPRLRGAAAASQRADAAVRTSRAYNNPSVEVFQGRQYARPISTPGVPGLLQHYAAYQTVEIPSERRARTLVAELARTSASFGQQGVTRSVIADVKHSFYNVLRQREEVEHQGENLRLVEDLRRRVEVEYRVGEKGRLELTRAEAELGRAGFALRGAQLELAEAIALLRIAIAAPADDVLDPQGTLEPRTTLPDLSVLREQVLRTHPALAQAIADVDTAGAKLTRERSLRIPQPTAFAEFENQPDLRFWRTGVTVPIPLWDRRRGPIGEAKAVISQAHAEADQRRLELIAATERAYEQYQLADQQATSLESGELRAASSAVDAAQAAYRFGERGIVEVLDAQRVLQGVRDDLLNAQFARQSALIDLEELGAIAPGGRP
jgi:cobalt-zinc-cadmium efflux system outer membrane protein